MINYNLMNLPFLMTMLETMNSRTVCETYKYRKQKQLSTYVLQNRCC